MCATQAGEGMKHTRASARTSAYASCMPTHRCVPPPKEANCLGRVSSDSQRSGWKATSKRRAQSRCCSGGRGGGSQQAGDHHVCIMIHGGKQLPGPEGQHNVPSALRRARCQCETRRSGGPRA